MSCVRGTYWSLLAVAVTAGVMAIPAIATAQSGYGLDYTQRAKVGAGNQDTYRSIRRAREAAEDSYVYSRDVKKPSPADAKTRSEELGQEISKAQKAIAKARTEAGDDAQTLSALKSVEKHLAAAADQHKMLHEECCKDEVNGSACMKHCSQILSELNKAQEEQAALIHAKETKTGAAK
jgi:hypothetical protein